MGWKDAPLDAPVLEQGRTSGPTPMPSVAAAWESAPLDVQPSRAVVPPAPSGSFPAPPLAGDNGDMQWTDPGYAAATTPRPQQPYSSAIWPVSDDGQGGAQFDSNAGILGSLKRAVQLPARAMRGDVDPTSREAIPEMLEAALVMNPVPVASRAASGKTLAPTRDQLKNATDKAYTEARSLGAEYAPSSMKGWADDMVAKLDSDGRFAENYPKVHVLLEKLRAIPQDAVSVRLEAVDGLYRELGKLGANVDEGVVANIVQKSLDDFHGGLAAADMVAGTASPARAAALLREGRANAAAGFRSDRITGVEQTIARRTASAASGRNLDNTIRQRLTSLVESTKGSRGLSKEEEAAIDDIIFGRPSKNAARFVGNYLGGGGGVASPALSAVLGVSGAAALGPMGAALSLVPPTVGMASRSVANRMSAKELKALDNLIRSRSPLAEKGVGQYRPTSIAKETMLKALMAQGQHDDKGMVIDIYNNSGMRNALGAN